LLTHYNYAIISNMEKEASKNEILEAINEFSTHVDQQHESLKSEIGDIKSEIGGIKSEIGDIKKEVGSIKALMVTKDYLDEKLADLRGDLVVLMRKEDTKVVKLIEILKRRKVITEIEEKEILSMEPFAKLFI